LKKSPFYLGFGFDNHFFEDVGGGVERSFGKESESEVQRRRHDRRPQEARGGTDRNPS